MFRRKSNPNDAYSGAVRHSPRVATRVAVSALFTSLAIGLLVAPSASAAPAPAQTAGGDVVKDGDSLFGISRKLGTPMADLLAANSLTVDSVVHPGQQLVIPANATKAVASAPVAPAPSVTYTVKSGDYLFGIARTLGTPIADLLATNKLTINSVVLPGAQLAVPASATNPNATTTPATPTAAAVTSSNYTVKSGDYLFGIARMYGISLGTLLKLNDLTASSVVLPGKTLLIPAGAVATSVTPVASVVAGPPTPTSKIDTVLAYARAQLGKPYRFNTAGPDTFDCSGLTAAAYAQVSVWLPHQSAMQSTRGVAIDWRTDDIQAGDLVFMFTNDHPNVISHVGIAINSWQWIHAPRPGDVVRLGLIPSDNVIQAVRRYVTD
jgi:LysM repeat protein